MTQQTLSPSLDPVFDALADGYRRRLLLALLDCSPRNAADALESADESDGDVSAMRVEMRHCHLPKLEAAGFIEWDPETNEVRRGPRFSEARPLLETLSENGGKLPDDWP